MLNKYRHFLFSFILLSISCIFTFPISFQARAQSSSDTLMGFNFTSWSKKGYAETQALDSAVRMEKTGSNTYTIIVTEYMDDLHSDHIGPAKDKTPDIESLEKIITSMKARGHKVILKPHVDFKNNEFRGHFTPDNPEKWFDSYSIMMKKYSGLAGRTNCDVLCVGTELKGTTGFEDKWRGIIKDCRQDFPGKLTYASDWTNYDKVPFWDALDYAGIDAYFPLADNSRPDMYTLVDSWMKEKKKIAKWQSQHGKPLILTEVGYRNAATAAKEPWAWGDDPKQDEQLQAMLYDATAVTWSNTPWLKGVQWWDWPAAADHGKTSFSPKDKQAENSLYSWFSGSGQDRITRLQTAYTNVKSIEKKYSGFAGFFKRIFGDYKGDMEMAHKEFDRAYAEYKKFCLKNSSEQEGQLSTEVSSDTIKSEQMSDTMKDVYDQLNSLYVEALEKNDSEQAERIRIEMLKIRNK